MFTNPPLVSIITPSFNKGPFIEETIESVQHQTYSHIEHIIIDGGSTDETLTILKQYNGRIIWQSEPDNGQSDAINKGWKMARGDIIAYLNADDTYLPDTIEMIVRYFNEHPDNGMIYGDGILTDEYGKKLQDFRAGEFNLKDLIFCRDNILQPTVFIRREVYEKVGDIDDQLHYAMDLDYWIRIGLLFKVAYYPKILATAKIYQNAKSVAHMYDYPIEFEHILRKIFSNEALSPEIKKLEASAYSSVFSKAGLDCLHMLKISSGIHYLTKAFLKSPTQTLFNCLLLIATFVKKRTFMIF